MSAHKTFTAAEREALKLHGLDADGPSQLSDAFVLGMRFIEQSSAPAAAIEQGEARLPHDVTVGGTTFRQGVRLSTFIAAAQRWHREAFPAFYTLTDEDKAANLARLHAGVPAPVEGARSTTAFFLGWILVCKDGTPRRNHSLFSKDPNDNTMQHLLEHHDQQHPEDAPHRWDRAVIEPAATVASQAPQGQGEPRATDCQEAGKCITPTACTMHGCQPMGRCCYGGLKRKADCASCAAWAPLAAQPAEQAGDMVMPALRATLAACSVPMAYMREIMDKFPLIYAKVAAAPTQPQQEGGDGK